MLLLSFTPLNVPRVPVQVPFVPHGLTVGNALLHGSETVEIAVLPWPSTVVPLAASVSRTQDSASVSMSAATVPALQAVARRPPLVLKEPLIAAVAA